MIKQLGAAHALKYGGDLKHGGDLQKAIDSYGAHAEGWLDMSTGISPWAYPVPELSKEVWQNLPPADDTLIAAASQYYQAPVNNIVATPGSQITIRLLPQCLKASTVAVPSIGYQEHARSWALAGHELCYYDNLEQLLSLVSSKHVEHAVLINPNNPSGELADIPFIENLLNRITGLLVIDEAFIDPFCTVNNQSSISNIASALTLSSSKLFVLRSVGKFFGLAGIRIGFAISANPLLVAIKTLLQPWSVSYASQVIAQDALLNTGWQQQQIERININAERFKPLLLALCKNIDGVKFKDGLLFSTVIADEASLIELHKQLATLGIWTRLFNQGDNPTWLRFSLPKDMSELEKRLLPLLGANKRVSKN